MKWRGIGVAAAAVVGEFENADDQLRLVARGEREARRSAHELRRGCALGGAHVTLRDAGGGGGGALSLQLARRGGGSMG